MNGLIGDILEGLICRRSKEDARISPRMSHSEGVVTSANIREPSVADQIHVLQRAAYAVEAQRIGSSDFPP